MMWLGLLVCFFSVFRRSNCLSFEEFLGYPFDREFMISMQNLRVSANKEGFPFFGKIYSYIYADRNGVLCFYNENDDIVEDVWKTEKFPMQQQQQRCTSVLAVYWNDANQYTGKLYYKRLLMPNDHSLLQNVSIQIGEFIGIQTFNATWGLIVTWKDVQLNYDDEGNTFQAAIATDGTISAAIFNYASGRITSRTKDQGLVGYNAGDGNISFTVDMSFNEKIKDIDSSHGNTGKVGHWIFRTDKVGKEVGEKLCFSNGIQQRIPFNVIATQESCSYGAIGRVAFCQKGTNRWFTSLSIKITSNSCPKTITELTNYTLTCKNNNKDCSTADPSLVIFEPESFVELEVNIESRTASQMRSWCSLNNEFFITTQDCPSCYKVNPFARPYIVMQVVQNDCTKLLCTSSSKEAKLLCTSSSKEAMDPKATDSIASEGSSQNKSDSSVTTALIVIAVILALLVLLCTVLLVISLSLLLLPRLKRKKSDSSDNYVNVQRNKYSEVSNDEISNVQYYENPEMHATAYSEPNYCEPSGNAEELYTQINKRKEFNELDIRNLELSHQLGEGQFGEVYKGRVKNGKIVAVKRLREGASEDEKIKLLKEAAIIGQFNHPNIVRLVGVAMDDGKIWIVMEYVINGDLQSYLLKLSDEVHRTRTATTGRTLKTNKLLLDFCIQISDAMAYLSKKQFIHRDLAARNMLLDKDLNCKVFISKTLADFGMSHDMVEDYYYKPKGGQIPVKWTAPEAILYGKYTTKSDVWSFGMVMFEIWSLGHKPFEEFNIDKTVNILPTGYCQPPPPGCPKKIYRIMVQCWNPEYHKRKKFPDIHQDLSSVSKESLQLSPQDSQIYPKAAILGGPLEDGNSLYTDLQEIYLTN